MTTGSPDSEIVTMYADAAAEIMRLGRGLNRTTATLKR